MAIGDPHGYSSFIAGLILTVLGGIPMLHAFGILGFALPGFLNSLLATVIIYLIALAGIFLIIDAFIEWDTAFGKGLLVAGIIIVALAIIPILNSFGVLPFGLGFLTLTVYHVIFTLEGILLMIAGFVD